MSAAQLSTLAASQFRSSRGTDSEVRLLRTRTSRASSSLESVTRAAATARSYARTLVQAVVILLRLVLCAGVLAACSDGDRRGVDAGPPPDEIDASIRPCGDMPGTLRGKSTHEILASGETRSFVYYAPTDLDEDTPVPLVIVAHGFGMSADQMFEITEYAALADRERFVVVFPNGQEKNGPPWNVGDPDCGLISGDLPLASGDDSRFIDELIAFVASDRCVDREHLFMTGFSMGGYFSNELGCNRTNLTAIAPHSGGSHDLSGCRGTIKPVIVFHFEDDAVVPYRCGTQARDRWIGRNGCQSANPMVTSVKGGQCEYYRGCDAGGQVAMCSFTTPGGTTTVRDRGHGWSGGSTDGDSGGAAYAISATESATSLSWSFFKNYAW